MIEARDLEVRFGVRGAVALAGVGLGVEAGSIVGLIGPPGAGKSVLVKALAGLVPLRAGEVRCAGEVVHAVGRRDLGAWQSRIGMAFQNDALFDAMTVFDNVAFPLRRRRVPEDDIEARVMQRLRDVELEGARARYPSEISGGMRKRTGIARATAIDPQLGLFDDPIAGLDPLTSARILALIVRLTEGLGMASVVISNDLAVLVPICDRMVMLHHGRVVFDGAADDMLRSDVPEVVQFATGSDEGPL